MPSKIQLDETLQFLYICLKNSDLKIIDFHAVGKILNINPPAARMRFKRLGKQLESDDFIGMHGKTFTASTEKKRKKVSPHGQSQRDEAQMMKQEIMPGYREISNPGSIMNNEEDLDGEFEIVSDDGVDSDDEKPLAKRRDVSSGLGREPYVMGNPSAVGGYEEWSAQRRMVPPQGYLHVPYHGLPVQGGASYTRNDPRCPINDPTMWAHGFRR